MFRNYLKVAWRNLKKNKLYSFVNIVGLSIGITSCILIGLYIGHELSYDRFHKNADRIVRATMEYSNGGTVGKYVTTGTKVGPQLTRTFPSIEGFVRIFKFPRVVTYGTKIFDENNFLFADSSFFKIFSFKLIKGDPNRILNTKQQLVITESNAKKYFGNEDPVGKIMDVSNFGNFTITGVVQDPPGNSQMHFDFVASFVSMLEDSDKEQWWTANYITYFLLHRADQLPQLQRQVTAYMNTKQVREEAGLRGNDYLKYNLEPLKRVHLYSLLNGFEPNGNITYIYILGAIAILILVIACV